jgi:hypothetical protein
MKVLCELFDLAIISSAVVEFLELGSRVPLREVRYFSRQLSHCDASQSQPQSQLLCQWQLQLQWQLSRLYRGREEVRYARTRFSSSADDFPCRVLGMKKRLSVMYGGRRLAPRTQ